MLFVFGWLLQRYVINLIVRAPMFMTLLLTFGVDLVLTTVLLIAGGAVLKGALHLFG